MHPLVRLQESQIKKTSNPRKGTTLFRSAVFRFPEDSPSLARKAVMKARARGGKKESLPVQPYRGRGLTEKKDGTFFWQPIKNGKFGPPMVISATLAAKLS